MTQTTSSNLAVQFEGFLPDILTVLATKFTGIRCADTRDDLTAEAVALSYKYFLSMRRRGRDVDTELMCGVAGNAAKSALSGRQLAGDRPRKDALSPQANTLRTDFEDLLIDDGRTPIPDQVRFRIDWPEFLETLPARDQEMIRFLMLGNPAKDAARKFGISFGRASQLRKQWAHAWAGF